MRPDRASRRTTTLRHCYPRSPRIVQYAGYRTPRQGVRQRSPGSPGPAALARRASAARHSPARRRARRRAATGLAGPWPPSESAAAGRRRRERAHPPWSREQPRRRLAQPGLARRMRRRAPRPARPVHSKPRHSKPGPSKPGPVNLAWLSPSTCRRRGRTGDAPWPRRHRAATLVPPGTRAATSRVPSPRRRAVPCR